MNRLTKLLIPAIIITVPAIASAGLFDDLKAVGNKLNDVAKGLQESILHLKPMLIRHHQSLPDRLTMQHRHRACHPITAPLGLPKATARLNSFASLCKRKVSTRNWPSPT